jgi:FkbM family methyltransferase
MVSDLTTESLVIEVGAGDGSSSRAFAQIGCTVHTFEPSTTMRDRAYGQLRDLQNVTLMPYAIGGNDRQATLYQCNDATANLYRPGGPQEGCTVVSMNHWFVYARIAEVDTLLLDCNGSECEILEQMIECDRVRQIRHLMIVWNDDEPERKAAICDELKKTHRLLCDGTQQWHRKDR